ncbi:ovostatin-like [Leptodactylus fuscus]|uniref:ovostatin-like n=1 Tax=Leptodactylus fuscus TaxID=238119 RepID=UPI003F4E5043
MTLKSLLVAVLLLGLLPTGMSQLQYALSIPAQLISGENGKACMNLQGYRQSLQLNVILQYSGFNISIFSETVFPPSYFQCKNFPVPVVQNDVPVLVLLSVTGRYVQILKRYSVVIAALNNIYLVQMDKPIYRPGQNVRFNVVSLSPQLLPVNETYPLVYLMDPMGSRLAQWLDQSSNLGLASFEFSLVDGAATGYYQITAQRESNNVVTNWFRVEEYEPPRFDVTLIAPYMLSVTESTVKFKVYTNYTYGEAVPGNISIRCCRLPTYGRKNNCFRDKNGVCIYKTANLASDGTYQGVIDLSSIQMDLSGDQTLLNLTVTVTESGTGVQVTKTQYLWMTGQLASINFEYDRMNPYYKAGIEYSVVVVLRDQNGQPIAGEEVVLDIEGQWESQTIRTGLDGSAQYNIDTSNFMDPNFTIRASYPNTEQCYYSNWQGSPYPTAEYTVYRFYSKNRCFVQIIPPQGTLPCGKNQSIDVRFLLTPEGTGAGATRVTFYYLAISRWRIVDSGQQVVNLVLGRNSTFCINLQVTSEMALRTDLLVYIILPTELITDRISINVESCFKNQVSLNFSESVGPPASNVDLKISASPGSLCAVKVFDSSLLLLNPDPGLTPESVYYSLPNWYQGYQIGEFDVEEPAPACEDPNKQFFCNGNYYTRVSSSSEGDSYNNLKNIGLVMGTDVTVRKPEVCGYQDVIQPIGVLYAKESLLSTAAAPSSLSDGTIETVRSNFVENWVWTMVSADSQGYGRISEKVPDTITQWKGSMICTSEKDGFGMTKDPAEFTAFLPFFVEMTVPYSFKRGEILVLNAFVANYLKECVKVQVSLLLSDSYVAVPQGVKQNICICSGERAYYTWHVNATSLGVINFTLSAQTTFIGRTCDGYNDRFQHPRKDTVIQSTIVEAEGIKQEVTLSNLICIQGKTPQQISMPIKIIQPQNVVPGSVSAFFTALGDIIGLPMQNLQNLLQMPFGCGEQNLARMAPIPHLLDYLTTTKQLKNDILQKAIEYMTIGYLRELAYRGWSGAYSLFGGPNFQENSWLTVNVFQTLESCKGYIYIDSNIQQQTLIWLGNSQRLDNGCFRAVGNPFIALSGETNDDIRFTALISIALLQSNYSIGETLLASSLTCLRNALNSNLSLYNKALVAYVFTLNKDWDRRNILLNSIKSKAIMEGGTTHWEEEGKPTLRPGFYPVYSPVDIEMTACILLCMAKGPQITPEDLSYMAPVAVWLVRQQNANGGFQSTPDTVMSLQALSAYGRLVFNPAAQHSIVLSGQNMQNIQFTLNNYNRFLVQSRPLSVPGDYNANITGIGCCLIQTTIRHNVPVPKENSAFLLSVNSSSASCVNGVAYVITIGISVSFRGIPSQSNMAVIDIEMITGYQADYWPLQQLTNSQVISKSEIENNHVYLYLKSVSRDTISLSFNVMMGPRVLNAKTASVYVYDYYKKADNGYASYRHPCAQQ